MPRFYTLADIAEQLQISSHQAYALVRSGELEAFQIGGRGQWRVEESRFLDFIERKHQEQAQLLAQEHQQTEL
ncbi:helix-turn-helix domain-containing protein [Micrococcoides hystricis]|uniref:Helix-turn-helix domain-containing protein n=1 Tax=Micrococcoides hystricis TaxID=1572761 RepID=A0ABV6P872_9MICC